MKKLNVTTKCAVLILLLTLAFSALEPSAASAQTSSGPQPQGVGSILADSAGCVIGTLGGSFLASLVQKGISALTGPLFNKIGSWLNLQSEVPVQDKSQFTKERVLDLVARCGARAVLNDMTGKMIGAVRTSGRDGGPGFVRDWKTFLAQGEYRGENVFRSILSQTSLCPYFSNDVRGIYNALYQPSIKQVYGNARIGNLNPYSQRANCTMPTNWTIQKYLSNFEGNGGWNALTKLAQPQNNIYGSILMANNELSNQRNQGKTEDIIEAIAGGGYTARRETSSTTNGSTRGTCSNQVTTTCTNNSQCTLTGPQQSYCSETPSITDCSNDATCVAAGSDSSYCVFPDNAGVCIIPRNSCIVESSNGQCVVYGSILTPGSVLSQSVGAVINNELGWVSNVHEMDELMSNLTRLLISRILNLSKPDVKKQEGFPKEPYPGWKGDPNFDPNLIPNPSETPTPTPGGGFCDGTDADGDGNKCDAFLGETFYSCPTECPLVTPLPVPQCEDGIDNDGDGLIDAPGMSSNPDPGCYGPTDNSELNSVATAECSDGFDNDQDGKTDYPDDPDCSSATDNSEISYQVNLCASINAGSPCQAFSASNPDLTGSVVGNDNAESLVASAIQYDPGFIVELCADPNYGNCTTITSSMFTSPGTVSDFNLNTVPNISNNTISSIRITQP